MKKVCLIVVFLGFSALFTNAFAQNRNEVKKALTVRAVTPTSWEVTKSITSSTTVDQGKTNGAIAGGAVGWLIRRNPLVIVGSALIGASANSKPQTTETETITKEKFQGYYILLSNGDMYRVLEKYIVGQKVDIETIKPL